MSYYSAQRTQPKTARQGKPNKAWCMPWEYHVRHPVFPDALVDDIKFVVDTCLSIPINRHTGRFMIRGINKVFKNYAEAGKLPEGFFCIVETLEHGYVVSFFHKDPSVRKAYAKPET